MHDRSGGTDPGRDGCRVPLPWTAAGAAYGFNSTGAAWLPQPIEWATLARDVQTIDPTSTLSLYRALLGLRRKHALGAGTLTWLDGLGKDAVAFRNGNVTVIANIGSRPIRLPGGIVIAASGPLTGDLLPGDTTAWVVGG